MQRRQTRCFSNPFTHRNQLPALRKWLLPLGPINQQPPGSDKARRRATARAGCKQHIWSDWEFATASIIVPDRVGPHVTLSWPPGNGFVNHVCGVRNQSFSGQADLVITEGQQAVRGLPSSMCRMRSIGRCHDEPHTFCVHWAIDTWGKGANGWPRLAFF